MSFISRDTGRVEFAMTLLNASGLTHVQTFASEEGGTRYAADRGLSVVAVEPRPVYELVRDEPAAVEARADLRAFACADVRCDGLFERVNREVQLAAISDAPDRLERLRYWHARQRSASRTYYLHGLCFARSSNNEPFGTYQSAGRYRGEGEAWLNAEA